MKRKTRFGKVMSLLLSLVLVIGVLPITAFATSQTAAEPETGTVELPTVKGGETLEEVDVIVKVETDETTGTTTTTKETVKGGDTTGSGLNVKYEGTEITVVPPTIDIVTPSGAVIDTNSELISNAADSADGTGTLVSSNSHYEVTDGKGYHAEGGSTTEVGQTDGSNGAITAEIIKDGKSNGTVTGSAGTRETTTDTAPTTKNDNLKADDKANFDQTTTTTEDKRDATITVTDPKVTVSGPTITEEGRPDPNYPYYVAGYWSINNTDNNSYPADGGKNLIYWEIINTDNSVANTIIGSDKVPDMDHYTSGNAGLYNIVLGKGEYHESEIYGGISSEYEADDLIGGLYCVDWNTDTADGRGYTLVNLEDAVKDGYYTEEQAKHLRAIINKGYDWSVGSDEKDADGNSVPGTASLAKFKALMKNALDEGKLTGVDQTNIDKLTRQDAAAITQIALWNYANRIDLTDGQKLGVSVAHKIKNGDNYEIQIDTAYTAMMQYLASLTDDGKDDDGTNKETQIISEDRFIKDMDIVIGSMVKDSELADDESNAVNKDANKDNDLYNVSLKFSLKVTPSKKEDDLIVSVVNGDGKTLASARIAGGDDPLTPDADGYYTLSGLHLQEGSDTTFNLKLEGYQKLTEGVYVFQSRIDDTHTSTSQNLIGKYEGKAEIDLNMQFNIKFNVEEGTVTTTREWRREWTESTPGGGSSGDDDEDPTVSIKGEKTWVYDENDDTATSLIPESITVNLLADGELTDSTTVKADKNGNWKYSFTGLPKFDHGKEIVYTVQEVVVEGFTATYDGYNITNTYTGKTTEEEKSGDDDDIPDGGTPGSNVPDNYDDIPDGTPLGSVPKTGDISGLWLALTALCGAGLLALTVFGKKREYDI